MKISTVLFAFLMALVLPAVSFATPYQELSSSTSPSKAGTSKSPKPVTLKIKTGTKETDPTKLPPTTKKAVIYFPAGSVYNGSLFPTCSSSKISSNKSTDGCPKGSIIGSGKATGEVPGGVVQNDLTIVAANGGKNKVNLFVEGSSPLRIQSNLVGTMSKSSGDYGLKMTMSIPENLQEPAPGVLAAITNFEVKIAKTKTVKGKKRGIIEVNKCSKGKWKTKGVFTYKNNPSITVTTSQKCTS